MLCDLFLPQSVGGRQESLAVGQVGCRVIDLLAQPFDSPVILSSSIPLVG